MVEAQAIKRRGEGAVIAFLAHLRRHGAAEHRDIGGRGAGNAGKEHAEQRDDLRQPAAHVSDHGLRQRDHPVGDVGRGHQFADQQEERHRQQDFGVDAVKHLPDHRLHADRREHAGRQHARHQREGDRHAHIAEDQKQGGHEQEDCAVAHFTTPDEIVGVFRALKAVAPAVDQLLDGEQHDQRAGDRHARRIGAERDQRRRAKAAHVVEKILDAEHQHASADRQNDQAVGHLHEGPLRPAHALGDLNQIEMIHAPRRGGHADENAPAEKSRGHQLQPEKRVAELARQHVEEDRQGKADDRHPAQHHQDVFERIQRAPFQMAMARDHKRRLVQEHHPSALMPADEARAAALSRHRPAFKRRNELLHLAHEFEQLDRMRAELLGDLVLDRLGVFHEAGLVDLLIDGDAHLLELRRRNLPRA